MIHLQEEILEKLSSRAITAYVAVSLAGNALCTTATLAGLVRSSTAVMLEGLKELIVETPEIVARDGKNKWKCGTGGSNGGVVLDSQRYRAFVDDLKNYWVFVNPTIPFNLSGPDGAAIRQFLRDHATWNQAEWVVALRFRAISVWNFGNGSRTEAFVRWVRRLGDYAAGPLNKFGKPVEGSESGKAIAIEQSNRQARDLILSGNSRKTKN